MKDIRRCAGVKGAAMGENKIRDDQGLGEYTIEDLLVGRMDRIRLVPAAQGCGWCITRRWAV